MGTHPYKMMGLGHCPFCGSDHLDAGFISAGRFAVFCDNCSAHGPAFTDPDYDEEGKSLDEWEEILTQKAIDAWNVASMLEEDF